MRFTAWEQSRKIERNYLTALRKLRRFIADLIGDDDTPATISDKLTALTYRHIDSGFGALFPCLTGHVQSIHPKFWDKLHYGQ